jgi:hypothetical protein
MMRKRQTLWNFIMAIAVAMGATSSLAAPQQIPYAGALSFESGAPYNGTVDLGVAIHTTAVGGAPEWSHTYAGLSVEDGALSVVLGGQGSPALNPAIFEATEVWIEFKVGDAPPLQPRQRVLSVPYALRAADAASLGGTPAAAFALGSEVAAVAADAAVVEQGEIAPGAVSLEALPQVCTTGQILQRTETGWECANLPTGGLGGGSVGQLASHGAPPGECSAAAAGTLYWDTSFVGIGYCDGSAWKGLVQSRASQLRFNRCYFAGSPTLVGSSVVPDTWATMFYRQPFAPANCELGVQPEAQCFAGLRSASVSGRDRDYRILGNGEVAGAGADQLTGPGMVFTNREGSGGIEVSAQFACPVAEGWGRSGFSRHRCTFQGTSSSSAGDLVRFRQFSAADCGGSLPPTNVDCVVALRTTQECGNNLNYVALAPGQSYTYNNLSLTGPAVAWRNMNYCPGALVEVEYLCRLPSTVLENSHRIVHCATTNFPNGAGSVSRAWTAADCGGQLPTGNCLAVQRAVSTPSGSEDILVGYAASISGVTAGGVSNNNVVLWNNGYTTGSPNFVAVDYLCFE